MSTEDITVLQRRYQLLGRLAVAAARGQDPQELLSLAVAEAVATIGLVAGGVAIFGAPDAPPVAEAKAGEPAAQTRMGELEESVFRPLRRNWALRSLFMTLDLDGPAGVFTYPLRTRDRTIGAISGLARGERNLALEEEFVGAIAAMIVLIGRTGPSWSEPSAALEAEREERVRIQAVLETGAALNHEINNPLMAVLGNVELLMRHAAALDPDTSAKLAKIHEAAERIKSVTHRVMRITQARSIPYPGGGRMLDIDGSPKRDDTA